MMPAQMLPRQQTVPAAPIVLPLGEAVGRVPPEAQEQYPSQSIREKKTWLRVPVIRSEISVHPAIGDIPPLQQLAKPSKNDQSVMLQQDLYFEFCDFGTNVVEISSGGGQQINLNEGTNPSFTGFRPLYLNSNPEATTANKAVWEMAFVWVANSYYFPPEFYLNVNPFTNTVELSNLNIIPNVTSCELMSENEIFDVNTGNLCMYRTVKVTNPVLFAKIPNVQNG
jgi:hypothetical protein